MKLLLALLLGFLLQSASAVPPRLAYLVPTHQAVLYLYEVAPGTTMLVNTCEVLSSGSWFGNQATVILNRSAADGYEGPNVYRAVAPGSGRLYLKTTSPETLEAGRVLVSLDDGETWQAVAGPQCRNTIIFPMLKRGAE